MDCNYNIFLMALVYLSYLKIVTSNQNRNSENTNLNIFLKNSTVTMKKSIKWQPSKLDMIMKQRQTVALNIMDMEDNWSSFGYKFHIKSEDENLLNITPSVIFPTNYTKHELNNITIEALFLGHTRVYVELFQSYDKNERMKDYLEIIIKRSTSPIDVAYKIIVACFVMVLYVNFGAVVQLNTLKRIITRPIGPAIGFMGQFILMPLLSYSIGYLFLRQHIELRLGLFFTGSTPGGSISNIFTVLLNGNLNLSITMTALSNLTAFGMMPLWLFTLGALIFKDGHLAVPYQAIAMVSCSLIVPLSVGIALQKCAPKMAKKMEEYLKPVTLILFLAITVFAFTVNSFIFRLFSWKIILASCALPWLGYCVGWLMAQLFKQTYEDALTIAIETGIQNTGIAIFMLNFTLPQPQADITSAIPVANSMLTPLPLLIFYLLRKIVDFNNKTSLRWNEREVIVAVEMPQQMVTSI